MSLTKICYDVNDQHGPQMGMLVGRSPRFDFFQKGYLPMKSFLFGTSARTAAAVTLNTPHNFCAVEVYDEDI
tara:strand:- start:705 stop:920 length:216 start_codon:yes stop_codon:yes gene_type:complete